MLTGKIPLAHGVFDNARYRPTPQNLDALAQALMLVQQLEQRGELRLPGLEPAPHLVPVARLLGLDTHHAIFSFPAIGWSVIQSGERFAANHHGRVTAPPDGGGPASIGAAALRPASPDRDAALAPPFEHEPD
jgi:hypothetical protein